jgi:DNA-directed RNA polymerase specialized sigma24 family protein
MEASAAERPRRTNRRGTAYILSEEDEFLLQDLPAHYVEALRQTGSLQEISARLQIPVGTVKSRTHRARVALDQLRTRARERTAQ